MLIAIALYVSACGGSSDGGSSGSSGSSSETASVAGKTVCFITAASSHPYVTPANQAIERIAEKEGVDLVTLSQEFDVQKGTDQLQTCVGRGVDGILLFPIDADAYLAGLLKAQQEGIPVIDMDSPLSPEATELVESFTGPDNYVTGTLSAELMNEALSGKGNIVVISGQAGNGVSVANEEGFNDKLEELGSEIKTLQTVYADFDAQKSLVVSRDLITRFGDEIDGVFAIDDATATGFVTALEESGLDKKIAVTGIGGQKDAFKLIPEGKMVGTVLASPVEDGEAGINTMIEALEGKDVPPRVPIKLPVITKENISEFKPAY